MTNYDYWRREFEFTREEHGDRVAIEAYRILWHYTLENPNCRAGRNFVVGVGGGEFYSLNRLVGEDFKLFEEHALKQVYKPATPDEEFLNNMNGYTDDFMKFFSLQNGLNFYHQPRSLWKTLRGYKFDYAFRFYFEPCEITAVRGSSLNCFSIEFENYCLDVWDRHNVSILSNLRYIHMDFNE